MSPSKLEISEHASERLKQRLVTRQNVRQCIADGLLIGTDINGRQIEQKKIGSETLVVVYINALGGQLVITAYWKGVIE